ncbi:MULTISPECIES: DUF1990 family protein [Microbacterium]|uniref:DUF1990 family protein n=1 Tax=Microbacterium TaxID=33882 RepID=UPI00201619C3|nr:DUF1990 family protein [Microbacterium sp. 4NA327F11]MCK9917996.1 DUF1990 domain-containing protein [Microbacteriaceae bacterium K1510]
MADIGSPSLTQVAERVWRDRPVTHRAWERSALIGSGDAFWRWCAAEVLTWGVKTRSGFTVDPARRAAAGDRPIITVRVCGASIREPVEVVDVVETESRVGFAYRTLPGHPVCGEEAFIVERIDRSVWLTIRSLTRSSDTVYWRSLYPLLRLAQVSTRRRYLRALREEVAS